VSLSCCCRWRQLCAARGDLPGQNTRAIKFARAPKSLSMDSWPWFGTCSGWTNAPCDANTGFANDDIYYLEVCLFSLSCSNNERLFEVDVGEDFVCEVDRAGVAQLQEWLAPE